MENLLQYTVLVAAGSTVATIFIQQIIIHTMNRRYYRFQRNIAIRENKRDQRQKLIEEISDLYGSRNYITRRLAWALESQDEERIQKNFQIYYDFLLDWNKKLIRYYTMVQLYFGKNARNQLENGVTPILIAASARALWKKRNNKYEPSPEIIEKMNEASGMMDYWLKSMIEKTEKESSLV